MALLRHRRLLLVGYLLLTLGAAPGLLRLRIDNSPEGFLDPRSPEMARFETLERTFGRDRAVRIAVTGEALWSRDGLLWLAELEREAPTPGGVYGALGPVGHHRWHLTAWPPDDPESFHRLLLADPLDREIGWLDRTGEVATVLVGLYRMPPERRRATLSALDRLVARSPPGIESQLVGIALVNRALDAEVFHWARGILPWLPLAAIVLMVGYFGSFRAALPPLALVAVAMTVLFGAIGYSGQRLDVVTMLLVPLVFVIGLATGIHVVAFHRERLRTAATGADPVSAVAATYGEKSWAVLWTGMTTCVGFGSLAVGESPAVRALGLWAAFGIAFSTLASLSFYPALLATWADLGSSRISAGSRFDARVGTWARAGARGATESPRFVGLAFLLVALIMVAGLPALRLETDVLGYLPADQPVRTAIETLQERGVGSVTASVVIEGLDDPQGDASLERLRRLSARLRDERLVLGAVGLGDLQEDLRSHLRSAGPPFEGRPGLLPGSVALTPLVPFLYDSRTGRTRILLSVPMRGFEALDPLFQRATTAARKAFPESTVHITGQYPLVLAAQRSLLRTMVTSFTLTLAVILVLLCLLLRSLSLAIRAAVPNVWPVLLVLGTMGWLGIPLDSTTIMIAAVVLGLAVDDTLHTLGQFRNLARTRTPTEAAVEAVAQTGAGHVASSIILTLGFAICAFADLVPVARFGMLSSLAILAALAADLWLVPVLLASARPSRRDPGWSTRGRR